MGSGIRKEKQTDYLFHSILPTRLKIAERRQVWQWRQGAFMVDPIENFRNMVDPPACNILTQGWMLSSVRLVTSVLEVMGVRKKGFVFLFCHNVKIFRSFSVGGN
jgi:hypothetical protein